MSHDPSGKHHTHLGNVATGAGERITAYLASGGLFNPELANHDAVRDLLMDCRDQLRAKDAEIERLTAEVAMWKGLQEGTVAATRAEADEAHAFNKLLIRERDEARAEIERLTKAGMVLVPREPSYEQLAKMASPFCCTVEEMFDSWTQLLDDLAALKEQDQ